jgi:hypothetical protein
MNFLQKGAIIILLTLAIYFVMVNLVTQPDMPLPTEGRVNTGNVARGGDIRDNVSGDRVNTSTGPPITGANVQPERKPFDTKDLASAQFNADATGVLPLNHERFSESGANFTSDITNINQFYKNNPELFHKSQTYVPNVSEWDQKGQELVNKLLQTGGSAIIQPSNFEHNFTSLI